MDPITMMLLSAGMAMKQSADQASSGAGGGAGGGSGTAVLGDIFKQYMQKQQNQQNQQQVPAAVVPSINPQPSTVSTKDQLIRMMNGGVI